MALANAGTFSLPSVTGSNLGMGRDLTKHMVLSEHAFEKSSSNRPFPASVLGVAASVRETPMCSWTGCPEAPSLRSRLATAG